jgi:deazaflavin-dependent oxidoreductase (nitroreductase family)
MGGRKPRYPTRADFEAGAEPVEAVPRTRMLRLMTGPLGHRLDRWCVRYIGLSFISWQASRDRGIPYQPSLLLTTTGRKSGIRRSVVLPYVAHGDRLVVVASNAGRAKAPSWVGNLRARPLCQVIVGRRRRVMLGHVAEGADRDRLMDIVAARRPHVYNYEYHARRNGRHLDLVILAPADRAK